MKKTELKKIVKECVKSLLEEYDPETDTMAYEPRDRDVPEEPKSTGELEEQGYDENVEIGHIKDILDHATEVRKQLHTLQSQIKSQPYPLKMSLDTIVYIRELCQELLRMHGQQ